MTAIVQELSAKREQYPLNIMYTYTAVIAYAYTFLERMLGEHIPENRIFAQYHKEYTELMKRHIVSEICSESSKIRFVLATVSLGMGLNAPHIRHVIHYKPPTSIEKYFQEVGRAGRDGKPAVATVYCNNTDVRSNRPGITKELITYCKQDNMCRRKFLLQCFGSKAVTMNGTGVTFVIHMCDHCYSVCIFVVHALMPTYLLNTVEHELFALLYIL